LIFFFLKKKKIIINSLFHIVPTIQGETIKVEKDEQGNMRVADGNVTFKDLLAENGIIKLLYRVSGYYPSLYHY
jgi:hypothetical protein